MKLLLVAPRFPPDSWSGAESALAGLYAQARRHHEVRLLAGWTRDRNLLPAEAVAVDLQGVEGPRAWARMSGVILREVRAWRPDLVVCNGLGAPPLPVPAVGLVHRLGKPGWQPSWQQGWKDRLRRSLGLLQARGMDAVIASSGLIARGLHEAGLSTDRIRVVHPGVDTERFHPAGPGARQDELVRFVYPSRILPGKGQHHAIDAVARLSRRHKRQVRLTIAGTVVDKVYLDQLRVQAWDQPVDFALDVPDMAELLRQHDGVLYPPELDEGFAFGAVEGMATGLPVIWADQPATRESTSGIGIPVGRGEVDSMRDAMARLIEDPELRRSLGEEGLRFVRGVRSWEHAWTRYETELQAVAR